DRSNMSKEKEENLDIQEIMIRKMVHALSVSGMNFRSFSGDLQENASEWLSQFEVIQEEWTEVKLLKAVKNSLRGRARNWFEALLHEEIKSFKDFEERFIIKYIKKAKSAEENNFNLIKLLLEGSQDHEFIDFLYRIKRENKESSISFWLIRKNIINFVPFFLRDKFEVVTDWDDMFELYEGNCNKVERYWKSRHGKMVKKSILVDTSKKKIECYICKEDHFASVCPKKFEKGHKYNSDGKDDTKCTSKVKRNVNTLENLVNLKICNHRRQNGMKYLNLIFNGKPLKALIDTGASHNFVSKKFVDEENLHTELASQEIKTATTRQKMCAMIHGELYINDLRQNVVFQVVENLFEKMILGLEFLNSMNAKID
ncbi:hypothetical protein H311_04220, partial [Anncaliia algerae PRA109]